MIKLILIICGAVAFAPIAKYFAVTLPELKSIERQKAMKYKKSNEWLELGE